MAALPDESLPPSFPRAESADITRSISTRSRVSGSVSSSAQPNCHLPGEVCKAHVHPPSTLSGSMSSTTSAARRWNVVLFRFHAVPSKPENTAQEKYVLRSSARSMMRACVDSPT